MKNRRLQRTLLIFILVGVIGLTGCEGREAKQPGIAKTTGTVGETCPESGYFQGRGDVVTGKTGYYWLGRGMSANAICYVDGESGDWTYLCAKPDCLHTVNGKVLESCDAYVKDFITESLVCTETHLYYLLYDYNTYSVILCRMGLDGSNHEEVMELGQMPDNTNLYRYIIQNDTVYYAYSPEKSEESRSVELVKADLNTKKKEVIYTMEETGGSIVRLKQYGEYLYFSEAYTDAEGNVFSCCSRIHMETNKKEVVADGGVQGYTINAAQNSLIYWQRGEGLYKLDLENLTATLLVKGSEKTVVPYVASDSQYIYLDDFIDHYYYKTTDRHVMTVYDFSGNEVNVIEMEELMSGILATDDMLFVSAYTNTGKSIAYIKHENLTASNPKWTVIQ